MKVKLSQVKGVLQGKKTYLIAASSLLALTLGWTDGNIDDQSFIESGVALVLAVTLRAGIPKGPSAREDELREDLEDIKRRLAELDRKNNDTK